MSLLARITRLFRRRPLTDEELEARAEAELVKEQVLDDKVSQKNLGGQTYRAGGR